MSNKNLDLTNPNCSVYDVMHIIGGKWKIDIIYHLGESTLRFGESFSFIYSPRPNTTASDMEDDVTQEEKKERLNILQERLNQLSFGFSRKKVGTLQNCLVYGQSKRDPGQLQGRTICNRVVNFPSNDIDLVGQIINIQINEALPNCLRGNLQN